MEAMTAAISESEVWRCRRHPSSGRRRCYGVCPLCLHDRLLLLCPDCAGVLPCACLPSAAAPAPAKAPAEDHSSPPSLYSPSQIPNSPSGDGSGAVGRVSNLIARDAAAIRRSRSSVAGSGAGALLSPLYSLSRAKWRKEHGGDTRTMMSGDAAAAAEILGGSKSSPEDDAPALDLMSPPDTGDAAGERRRARMSPLCSFSNAAKWRKEHGGAGNARRRLRIDAAAAEIRGGSKSSPEDDAPAPDPISRPGSGDAAARMSPLCSFSNAAKWRKENDGAASIMRRRSDAGVLVAAAAAEKSPTPEPPAAAKGRRLPSLLVPLKSFLSRKSSKVFHQRSPCHRS